MDRINYQVQLSLLIIMACVFVYGTVDLNIHELQFIADHLSDKECLTLYKALKTKEYVLKTDVQSRTTEMPPAFEKPKPTLTLMSILTNRSKSEVANTRHGIIGAVQDFNKLNSTRRRHSDTFHKIPSDVLSKMKRSIKGREIANLKLKNSRRNNKTHKTPSCIALLITWDRHGGFGKTFHDLALRLKQLGHGELADKLSRTVYHEKAELLKQAFLTDPFKKTLPAKSVLLDKENDENDDEDDNDEEDNDKEVLKRHESEFAITGWQLLFTITGMVTAFLFLCVTSSRCCPGFCYSLGVTFFGQPCMRCCGRRWQGMKNCSNRCRKDFDEHFIGSRSSEEQSLFI